MEEYNTMQNALEDISNSPTSEAFQDTAHDPNALPERNPPPGSEDRYEEVRKQGWTERTAVKYDELAKTDGYEWAGGATRYEWTGEEGDIGPRNLELEEQLFNDILIPRVGTHIEA